jgi:hypothetical protein
MAMQYARVVAYALVGLVYLWRKDWPGSPFARLRAVFRLSLTTMRIFAQASRWRLGSA